MKTQWHLKVEPIVGDLTLKELGLSPKHKEIIINEVQIIINCAASVNFDDPLLDALNINYMGCMRILDLAEQSNSLLTFTHVSTAYVNSDRQGLIEEKIYDLPGG